MKTQHFIYYLAVVAVLFAACKKDKESEKEQEQEPDIPVVGITLNQTELMLALGDTVTLIAIIEPADATNKNVTWTSSNYAVATVTENGLITALAEGETTITVTTKDGNKTSGCEVTVVKEIIPVIGVTLNQTELMLVPGDTITLIATVEPADATNKTVIWTSNNPAVVTVNETGLVTAMANGNATITAATQNGKFTDNCSVTVDYRTKWMGEWNFTTIDYLHYYSIPADPSSLIIIHDTICFIGTIEKYENDRLKIVFKPNATAPDMEGIYFPLRINGLIYPVVDDLGNFDYSNLKSSHNSFSGEFYFSGFISGNEISIDYSNTGPLGMAAYETHNIHGIKSK